MITFLCSDVSAHGGAQNCELVRRCSEYCQYCWYCFCSWFLISSTWSVANSGCSFWVGRRSASFAAVSTISFLDLPTCPGIQMSTALDGTAEIWLNMSCASGCGCVWFLELSKRRADKESASMQFPLPGDSVIALTAVCMTRSSTVKTWANAVNYRFFWYNIILNYHTVSRCSGFCSICEV